MSEYSSKNKKAAMEMTMGTIVTIVILVSVLILSLILVKNIMCAGIIISDQISTGVENELKNIFGNSEYGVKCMGEEQQEVKLGDGGRRKIICVVNTDETSDYKFKLESIESMSGASTSTVKDWVLDKGGDKNTISPPGKTVVVSVLDIPKNVEDTALKIKINEDHEGTETTHTLYIDVKHIGTVTSAMC